jgi:hypothetical protein
MIDRLLSAVVALSLAFLVWMYMRSRDQEILDNVPVPVQVRLAAGQEGRYELENTGPTQVTASFTGPRSGMRELRSLLQRGQIRVDTVLTIADDRLEESHYRDTVRVEAADIHAPPGMTVAVLEGKNRIPVTVHRLVERSIPVRFQHAADDAISKVTVEPAAVLVRGPQDILDRIQELPVYWHGLPPTTALPSNQSETRVDTLSVQQELQGHRIRTTPATVKARLTLRPEQRFFEVNDVPVQFLCPPNFALRALFGDERAGKITLRVQGPAGEEAPAVIAFIDLSGRKWEPGLYEEPVKVHLPRHFKLATTPAPLIAFQLATVEPPARTPVTTSGQ